MSQRGVWSLCILWPFLECSWYFEQHPSEKPQCPILYLLEDCAWISLKQVTKFLNNSQIFCCTTINNLLFFINHIFNCCCCCILLKITIQLWKEWSSTQSTSTSSYQWYHQPSNWSSGKNKLLTMFKLKGV